VDIGDESRESAGFRQGLRVKLFAKKGEGNKPRNQAPNNHHQTLF
jgi:hypothetical protein